VGEAGLDYLLVVGLPCPVQGVAAIGSVQVARHNGVKLFACFGEGDDGSWGQDVCDGQEDI
jgi:hypothetical protein